MADKKRLRTKDAVALKNTETLSVAAISTNPGSNTKSWLQKIEDAFTDLTDIRVMTISGKIEFTEQPASTVKLQDLLDLNINTSELYPVLATNISLIGKTTLVISSSNPPTENMILAHNSAVDAARETRTAICTLIKDAVVEAVNAIKNT